MSDLDCEVLIVGAGPAGLSAAIELGRRGIDVLLVERTERGGHAPRAKTTNVRTRTHLRRWGIADRLAAASPLGVNYPNDVVFVTRLADHGLARFSDAFNAAPERSPLYPEHAQWIPQYTLEAVLREHLATLPSVRKLFGTDLVAAAQQDDRVFATLAVGGAEQHVAARYLIGADGARSTVREIIGAKMEGRYGLSRNYNIVFRAPGLAEAHSHGKAVMYWQMSRAGASLIGPMDADDVWFFMPTGMMPGETLTTDEAAEAIAKATGIDLPYEIISTDEWVASELLADRYTDGRIVLIGDAAHLHPPFGGYGMNMGVGDGVDVGWKMAALLRGWGGPALVPSYESERRQVHREIIAEAVANHAALGGSLYRDGLEDDTTKGAALRESVGKLIHEAKHREFHTLSVVLGTCYENSPIIADRSSSGAPYPSGEPGSLAPHAWLDDGRSVYDLFGEGFTLVSGSDSSPPHVAAAMVEAAECGIPLVEVRLETIDVATLYGAPLVLIRPDQHVAWRGTEWHDGMLRRAAGFAHT